VIPVSMSERRASSIVVAGTIVVFVLLLLLVPPFYRSFDESKYLGIGYNMFSGVGPRTVFGASFLLHSPLWAMVVVAPRIWFGIDPFAWGHLLNAVSGAAILALVAALGWRIRPAVGAFAAVGYLAVPYLHDLTRTSRLDVPAAALALAYVVVGIDAVRRGSVGRGVLAGAIFAVAFLVKEIVLPFAPVPFLVGALGGRPWAVTLRVAAATLAAAALGTAWWFVMYAGYTRTIYRLGAPAGLLLALYVGLAAAVVAGLAMPWLASRSAVSGWLERAHARAPGIVVRYGRALAAWGAAFAWFLALTLFFDRVPDLKGNGLFRADQYALYARTWLPQQPLVPLAIVGVALSLPARRAATQVGREAIDALYLTLLCSLPLVLLVVAVGEPPRNYLAQIGVLAAVSAAGWLWAVSLVPRLTSPIGAVLAGAVLGGLGGLVAWVVDVPILVGLVGGGLVGVILAFGIRQINVLHQSGRMRLSTAGKEVPLLVSAFVLATLILANHALASRSAARDTALESAVVTAADWIEANVDPGAKIGFGSFLSYETAVELPPGAYSMVQLDQVLAVVDPTAPLALAAFRQPPIDDWIAIENSRRETEFFTFRAQTFAEVVRRSGISIYVYQTGPITSVPALLGALTPEHGFTELMSWSYPTYSGTAGSIERATHIYAVDQTRVGFEDSPMYATAGALGRLVSVLERDPDTSPATAANLLESISIWPPSTPPGDLFDRLEALTRR